MAFNGYLIKVGQVVFPLSFVYKESYSVTPNRRMDLDSFRNGYGVLERTVLDHSPSTIKFQTVPMDNSKLEEMMSLLRENYVNEKEKKLYIEYYCPDTNSYKYGNFYVPDIEFPIHLVDLENNKILYKSFTLEFIEY